MGAVLQAPFPWFGGKSRAASLVWARFGDVPNMVEPFFGSGAVLLGRPDWDIAAGDWRDGQNRIETVNDLDGFVANAWRAIQGDPEQTAHYADWPCNENDLTARHIWLVQHRAELTSRLEGDPDYYDAKIAGYWIWGQCLWIGGGWCSGQGPWQSVDGRLVCGDGNGEGVKRQLVHLGWGMGVHRVRISIHAWFEALSARLRRVRVCCGDWSRVCRKSTQVNTYGLTGILLDPPYSGEERDGGLYAIDSGTVAAEVRQWAIEHGDDPLMRIALCGYDTEHAMPDGWTAVAWETTGGWGRLGNGRGRENASREVVWFNRSCMQPEAAQPTLFDLEVV